MSGGTTAVELARALNEAEAADEEEQLGLFAEPETEAGRLKVEHMKRGRGRPPGARNKRIERTVAWLLARHKDPVDGLLEIADMHPADLAAMLFCTMLEAVQEQRLCRIGALPYVKQRQPLAIDVTKRSVVYLRINKGEVEQAKTAGGTGVAVRILENVEYQQLSGEEQAAVGQSGVGQDDEALDPTKE